MERLESLLSHELLPLESFPSAFLTLFSSTVGSGLLGLPYAIHLTGWPLGLLLLSLGLGLNLFTCYLLVKVMQGDCVAYALDSLFLHAFQGINQKALTSLTNFTRVNVILNNYGFMVSYFIVVLSKQMENAVARIIDRFGDVESWNQDYIWVFPLAVLIYPLCLFNVIGTLRYSSIITLANSICIAVLIVTKLGKDENPSLDSTPREWENPFLSIPIILFAYTNQSNLGDIYKDMCNRERNGVHLISLVLGCVFVLYTLVGLCGCAAFPVSTNLLQAAGWEGSWGVTVRDR